MFLYFLEALPVPSSLSACCSSSIFVLSLPLHFQAVYMWSLLCVTCSLTEGNVILKALGLLETLSWYQCFPISTCLQLCFSSPVCGSSSWQGCAMKCLSTEILRVESKPKKETVLSQEVFLGSIALSCIKTKLHILKFAILLHLTIYYRGYCLEMSRWISVWWVTAMLKKPKS